MISQNEKVMCLKNNKTLGLFNGMQGRVTRLYEGKNMIDFTSSEGKVNPYLRYATDVFGQEKPDLMSLDLRNVNPFDYAYCVTCHKAQGDEWDHVLVIEQRCKNWEHKRWAYTAASRAKEKLTWIAAPPPKAEAHDEWF
jgi:exodeoxyribonuclease-5